MAYSGTVGATPFNAQKVVDHAFRRCRLPAQAITAEMQTYALESLHLFLSGMANIKTPSWCIEKLLLPMYENQSVVRLPQGTVEVLNLGYRTITAVSGFNTLTAVSHSTSFVGPTKVETVGILWSGASVELVFAAGDDGLNWTTVGGFTGKALAGERTWVDIVGAKVYRYFRISADQTFNRTEVVYGTAPHGVPMGQLNRDNYVSLGSNAFQGSPSNYYFQRDLPEPVVNLWPAPGVGAEQAQLVLWRHRHIMDIDNLRQDVEVPKRWLDAIVDGLAAKVACETPQVDIQLIPMLEQRAAGSLERAVKGDNDGSTIQINPGIGAYTS